LRPRIAWPEPAWPGVEETIRRPLRGERSHTRESAEQLLQAGEADAVAFGKAFIANPDLVKRFARNAPLNPPDTNTFYADGPKGYTDYPALAD
jgi:2,4-dienoyl-CoA reductase-like NADH-dependent reductase (Old Yellow Enzyme family)